MNEKTNYFEQLRKNWLIIAFIAGLIVGWTNINNQLDVQKTALDQLKLDNVSLSARIDTAQSQVANISGDIKEIKASLSFIKDNLNSK